MLFRIFFFAFFCSLNAFFIKDDDQIFQDVDSNSSLSKGNDFEYNSDIFGSDSCSCKNGRCLKDRQGKLKCMCNPKHSMQGKDCALCYCGKEGKCIFTETFSEETRSIQYEKKCVCDTGYADRYGTCTECVCGVNSKCEFENGEKNCYCMDGYAELNGVCTECDCGEGGYCEFLSGEKICTCYNGYLFDGDICREGCYGNEDCEDNQKCVEESDGWKVCQCADGLSGSNCDIADWCENGGKFEHCRDINGTCEYDREKRSIDCKCRHYEGLHPEENRCRETCTIGYDCHNGGVCEEKGEHNFCSCKPGLIGDKCETVFDCTTEGNYKGCVTSGGTCSYDGEKVTCECPRNKLFNDKILACEDCDCGTQGTCSFVDGKKKCDCARGYVEELGRCREGCYEDDDCEHNQKCVGQSHAWKVCQCADGLSGSRCDRQEWCENGGKFEHCRGSNGTCDYEEEKRSIDCKCSDYKKLHPKENRCRDTCNSDFECYHGGVCEENGGHKFCSCKPGFIGDWCETVFDCTMDGKYKGCVKSGGACSYEDYEVTCTCPGNNLFNYKTLTCEECDCGLHGKCRFVEGQKTCDCDRGFVDESGTCREGCYVDWDCEENEKCSAESQEWKSCKCADGLSGRYCDVKEWCESDGKFKYCRGSNGTCEYIKEKRSVDCTCDTGTKLHPLENRCKDACTDDSDCYNRGTCKNNFCTCKAGLLGDKCETIFDCTEKGRFSECTRTGGICNYDGRNAVCNCPDKKKYHEMEKGCKATCSRDDDCKDTEVCREINDWMTCVCADGLSGANCEKNDWCEDYGKFQNCRGANGTCEYVKHRRSVECTCGLGKKLHPTENRCRDACTDNSDCMNGGTCKNNFCTCKAGLFGDKCETIFDCTEKGKFRGCVTTGGICFYDGRSADCECPPNNKYHEMEHACTECYCGSKGSCRFEYGQKKCDCLPGSAVKDGICTATCMLDDDCKDNEVCREINDWSTCVCADGLSGAYCEKHEWCHRNGKFKNCNGVNGTCDYFKDKRSVDCTCPVGKALHPIENRCREPCGANRDCSNGGTCKDQFCSCNPGLFGDKCEFVFDCTPYGKYKDCVSSGGKCYYDGYKAVCECSENKILHDKELICKECHCGDHGSCAFYYDEKICLCDKGYSEKNGKCEICDCGENGYCAFVGDEKVCKCDASYSENNGKCESCDCGEGGWCVFINGEKTCECGDGYSEQDGKCENCDCGVHGWCYFVGAEKLCKCEEGYAEKNGICEACSCGKNSVCKFIYGAKTCLCTEGYTFNDVTGECEECDCGDGAVNCSFARGLKHCSCRVGFSEEKGQCKRLQSCEPNPCVNGHCVMRETEFLCVCDDPFTGRYCEISSCIETNCLGGRCRVVGKREECVCPVGHKLENGTCTKTFCVEKKCYDGECVIENGVETCICPDGYVLEGNECRKVKCSKKSCIGGTCRIIRGNIEDCVCPLGHVLVGDTCKITTCTPRTCYGGRCEKIDGELVCICPDGFHLEGVGCIETTCKEQNCFGGKCRVIKGKEICTCLDGQVLKNDQCQKVRCVEKNCFGGKCDVVDGEEVCSCPVGFEVQGDVCREI